MSQFSKASPTNIVAKMHALPTHTSRHVSSSLALSFEDQQIAVICSPLYKLATCDASIRMQAA